MPSIGTDKQARSIEVPDEWRQADRWPRSWPNFDFTVSSTTRSTSRMVERLGGRTASLGKERNAEGLIGNGTGTGVRCHVAVVTSSRAMLKRTLAPGGRSFDRRRPGRLEFFRRSSRADACQLAGSAAAISWLDGREPLSSFGELRLTNAIRPTTGGQLLVSRDLVSRHYGNARGRSFGLQSPLPDFGAMAVRLRRNDQGNDHRRLCPANVVTPPLPGSSSWKRLQWPSRAIGPTGKADPPARPPREHRPNGGPQ